MTDRHHRSACELHRRLRRADALLREAERVLHDLPDHYCPIDLLARVRLHYDHRRGVHGFALAVRRSGQ